MGRRNSNIVFMFRDFRIMSFSYRWYELKPKWQRTSEFEEEFFVPDIMQLKRLTWPESGMQINAKDTYLIS